MHDRPRCVGSVSAMVMSTGTVPASLPLGSIHSIRRDGESNGSNVSARPRKRCRGAVYSFGRLPLRPSCALGSRWAARWVARTAASRGGAGMRRTERVRNGGTCIRLRGTHFSPAIPGSGCLAVLHAGDICRRLHAAAARCPLLLLAPGHPRAARCAQPHPASPSNQHGHPATSRSPSPQSPVPMHYFLMIF
jgi:hypothetical protein